MSGTKSKNNGADPRVAKALDDLGIRYQVDTDGDYQFGFQLEAQRTQRAFIRSITYEFLHFELREIFSIGLRSVGTFDARTANHLLKDNESKKIGAWSVISDKNDNHLAVFTAKIGADANSNELVATIMAVLDTADKMERHFSGQDDF